MISLMRRSLALILSFVVLSACFSLQRGAAAFGSDRSETTGARHLIICVDGVGYSTIQKMRAEGRFKMFGEPSRMIAPFPTLTNVAMSEILEPAGALPAAGYEDNFYDLEKNRLRGGLLDRFNRGRFIEGTFRELFDYHPSAIKSGLGYAAPPLSTYVEALTDILRLKQKFRSSSERDVFFAYTGATDSLAHLGGEWLLRKFLSHLDEAIIELASESSVPLKVTIFSDHGNHFRDYRRVSLKEPLRRVGMRLEGRVRNERSVVLPQFGLVGCAVLFTKEANEARLADVVSKTRGVDFAAYEKGGAVYLISSRGKAMIEEREGRFRYRVQGGDPLELAQVMRELTAKGKADIDGYISGEEWFKATVESERPNAVRRIYEGALAAHVRNRANVIVNLEDGYYVGSFALDILAILQATHGNLGREQSFGFVMTTANQSLPEYLPATEVWSAIGSPTLRNSTGTEKLSAQKTAR